MDDLPCELSCAPRMNSSDFARFLRRWASEFPEKWFWYRKSTETQTQTRLWIKTWYPQKVAMLWNCTTLEVSQNGGVAHVWSPTNPKNMVFPKIHPAAICLRCVRRAKFQMLPIQIRSPAVLNPNVSPSTSKNTVSENHKSKWWSPINPTKKTEK